MEPVLQKGGWVALAALTASFASVLVLHDRAIAQDPGCVPTSARIVGPHSFRGLVPRPVSQTYTDAVQFASSQGLPPNDPLVQQEITALQNEGFVSGRAQLFNPPKHRKRRGFAGQALSSAKQLGSPEQAIAETSRINQLALSLGHWRRFKVAEIPGSMGIRTKPDRDGGASNVFFSDGVYSYLVGEAAARGNGSHAVISASKRLYRRVHNAPVCSQPI
jgi:hypothetical protein